MLGPLPENMIEWKEETERNLVSGHWDFVSVKESLRTQAYTEQLKKQFGFPKMELKIKNLNWKFIFVIRTLQTVISESTESSQECNTKEYRVLGQLPALMLTLWQSFVIQGLAVNWLTFFKCHYWCFLWVVHKVSCPQCNKCFWPLFFAQFGSF